MTHGAPALNHSEFAYTVRTSGVRGERGIDYVKASFLGVIGFAGAFAPAAHSTFHARVLAIRRRSITDEEPGMKLIIWGALAVLVLGPVQAQQGDGTDVVIQAKVFKPAKVDASEERIASLKVPAGFTVAPFASGLKNARIIAVAPSGAVYVSRRDQGDVLLLQDANHDGKADGSPIVVANRAGAHGLAVHDNKLYLATVKEVFQADIRPDGTLGPLTMLIGDLPDSGQHPNRTLAFGPDGMMYISVGSTCNACNESNPENATLLQASADGKSRVIFATGLRNTIGFAWHPTTGELWGLDHGIDFLGDEVQAEELNKIEKGKQYGWPHVFADGGINPQSTPPGEITKEQWKALSTPMVLGYAAHAAPMQLVFNTGSSFPKEYRSDAFATMRGSWNRNPASGYELVRIRFKNGKPSAIEPFVSGFLSDGRQDTFCPPGRLGADARWRATDERRRQRRDLPHCFWSGEGNRR